MAFSLATVLLISSIDMYSPHAKFWSSGVFQFWLIAPSDTNIGPTHMKSIAKELYLILILISVLLFLNSKYFRHFTFYIYLK